MGFFSELFGGNKPAVLRRLYKVKATIPDEYSRRPFVMAINYIKAVEYLDGCGEFALVKLRRAYEIAGLNGPDTDAETARLWEQSKHILSGAAAGRGSNEPGGPEFLRFDLRRNYIEGITNAAPHCGEASSDVREWLAANRRRA